MLTNHFWDNTKAEYVSYLYCFAHNISHSLHLRNVFIPNMNFEVKMASKEQHI